MNKPRPSSVTIEEAVAQMVNMDYIPPGCTLLDMTEAFLQEAEADVDAARLEDRPSHVRFRLEQRLRSCRFRHDLAETLLSEIDEELRAGGPSLLVRADDATSGTRLTTDSVWQWASDRYGIGIPEWAPCAPGTAKTTAPTPKFLWTDVTIKIYENYRLAWSHRPGDWKQARFADHGLMGRRKHKPNQHGDILIDLSEGKKFPSGGVPLPIHKTTMSRLRQSLLSLTGLEADPFYPFNRGDGWKPRFRLIDDRRNADERAKREAIHVPYSEARDFDPQDDDAQDNLDQEGRR